MTDKESCKVTLMGKETTNKGTTIKVLYTFLSKVQWMVIDC